MLHTIIVYVLLLLDFRTPPTYCSTIVSQLISSSAKGEVCSAQVKRVWNKTPSSRCWEGLVQWLLLRMDDTS
jgi:hypothetical protein